MDGQIFHFARSLNGHPDASIRCHPSSGDFPFQMAQRIHHLIAFFEAGTEKKSRLLFCAERMRVNAQFDSWPNAVLWWIICSKAFSFIFRAEADSFASYKRCQ
ncbi:MAG: hypothetical protein Q7S29_03890 [Candidatus Peribacter sp.]|nr:hypothetical protein [Candidatus Peribacter sp.]